MKTLPEKELLLKLMNDKKYDEVIAKTTELLELEPRNASLWGLKGVAHTNGGDIPTAHTCFRHSLELSEGNDHMGVLNYITSSFHLQEVDLAKSLIEKYYLIIDEEYICALNATISEAIKEGLVEITDFSEQIQKFLNHYNNREDFENGQLFIDLKKTKINFDYFDYDLTLSLKGLQSINIFMEGTPVKKHYLLKGNGTEVDRIVLDLGEGEIVIISPNDISFTVKQHNKMIVVQNAPMMVMLSDLLIMITEFKDYAKNEKNLDLIMGNYYLYSDMIASASDVGIQIECYQALLDSVMVEVHLFFERE